MRFLFSDMVGLLVRCCGVIVLLLLCFGSSQTHSADGNATRMPPPPPEDYQRLLPRKAPTAEMVFVGKAHCSLKRNVDLPYQGTITALEVSAGQAVRQGEVLARYRLSPETVVRLRHKTAPLKLIRLEAKLGDVRRQMSELRGAQRDPLKPKRSSESSRRGGLDGIQRQLQPLLEEESTLAKDLELEQQWLQEDLEVLTIQLGATVTPGQIPEEVTLIAPISGHVVWVHPEMRPGVELGPVNPVFMVGVMDPMLLRARVYEEEALRLELGDRVTVLPESRPGRRLKAMVSRISWSPLSLDPEQPSYYEVEFGAANRDLVLREGLRVIIRLFKPPPRPARMDEANPSGNGSPVE